MSFGSKRSETAKLGLQRITVSKSEAGWSPLLANRPFSMIGATTYVHVPLPKGGINTTCKYLNRADDLRAAKPRKDSDCSH